MGGWHTPGSPRLSPVTPPANSRPTGFRQTALSPEADLFRCLAQGEDAMSAPTFLQACAFPDTLTTEKPVLETSDAEMKDSPALGRVTMCLEQPEEHNTLREDRLPEGTPNLLPPTGWDNCAYSGFSYIVSFYPHNSVSLSPFHRWGQRLHHLPRSQTLETAAPTLAPWLGGLSLGPWAHCHTEESMGGVLVVRGQGEQGGGHCRQR